MCKYCEKKIRNLKNAKVMPQTYIGKRFGNVVIIDCYWLYKSGRNRIYVDYKCDCGTIKTSNIEHLLQGQIISCGCIKTKRTIARNKKHGLYNDNKRLFDVWNNMIQRCENSKNNSFGNYGKRGIKVCREWHDLKTFIDWAKSSGYEERDKNNRSNVLSIERIDVNGNYEPNNCKWIPVREQAWNKRNSKMCRKEARRVIKEFCDICKVEIDNQNVLAIVSTPVKTYKVCKECLDDLIQHIQNKENNFKLESKRYERDYNKKWNEIC